jgi:hypothetical protein
VKLLANVAVDFDLFFVLLELPQAKSAVCITGRELVDSVSSSGDNWMSSLVVDALFLPQTLLARVVEDCWNCIRIQPRYSRFHLDKLLLKVMLTDERRIFNHIVQI